MILYDSKEKQPWRFDIYGMEQERVHLETGDYTIKGMEDSFIIERKKSPSELARNLGVERRRFEAELQRMESFKYRYIICEFSLEELSWFPRFAKIPQYLKRKIRIRGPYLVKRIQALCEQHGIELIFNANKDDATTTAIEIINKVLDDQKTE